MVFVTLILSTYNEAENIEKILKRVMSWNYSIIVVDDNSPDGTANIVRKRFESVARSERFSLIVRTTQRGLGSAIRAGALEAKTPWVAIMDCDGQHSLDDVFALLDCTDDKLADIYIGSRLRMGGNIAGLPPWRRLATKILNWVGGLRAKSKATDYLTGMFIARREHVLSTKGDGFKILYEILKGNKLQVSEIPITLYKRAGGKSKASFTEIARYLKLVFS